MGRLSASSNHDLVAIATTRDSPGRESGGLFRFHAIFWSTIDYHKEFLQPSLSS